MEKKTKKVAVIWFGEVPEDARNAALSWGIGNGSGGVLDIELIDIDPPKPKPETLQDVLKDRPSPTSYTSQARFVEAYKGWDKRLEAVEEVKDA